MASISDFFLALLLVLRVYVLVPEETKSSSLESTRILDFGFGLPWLLDADLEPADWLRPPPDSDLDL